ncbi:MAG TPA: DUF1648 domain-containing protein [Pyrinomonadaceae bacterium]|nr:DUF1648 domain-containing protein [Pyrinomonadaceae bacterium]
MGDYTKTPFEIFIVAFSILPFFVLAYFYPLLPERVPLFLNLQGEVETWAGKSVLSVFRVPLMAVDTQLVCLLMKYGTVASETAVPLGTSEEQTESRKQYLRLSAGLWDWLRCLVAFKMSASSLDTMFLSLARFRFLSRPAFAITVIAALLSLAGALFYGYRLLIVRRGTGERFGDVKIQRAIDTRRVYGGVLYFNPSDPALFTRRYIFNFANIWAWVFIACLAAYPLLVLLPT